MRPTARDDAVECGRSIGVADRPPHDLGEAGDDGERSAHLVSELRELLVAGPAHAAVGHRYRLLARTASGEHQLGHVDEHDGDQRSRDDRGPVMDSEWLGLEDPLECGDVDHQHLQGDRP